MRIVCISDTHDQHDKMVYPMPDGDVLVHAGDLGLHYDLENNLAELIRTADWLSSFHQKYKKVLVIGGNHDGALQHIPDAKKVLEDAGVIYLEDDSYEFEGRLFYGSPWTPTFFNWYFMKSRNTGELADVWKKIPANVDVLITHGPIFGVRDVGFKGEHGGDEELAIEFLTHRIRPKLHVFGHFHSGYGVKQDTILTTTFVDASIVNEKYDPIHKPIVIEL